MTYRFWAASALASSPSGAAVARVANAATKARIVRMENMFVVLVTWVRMLFCVFYWLCTVPSSVENLQDARRCWMRIVRARLRKVVVMRVL